MLLSLATGILILQFVLQQIQPAISQLKSIVSLTGMESDYAEILLKSVGVCFLTQLAGDVCRDAGEQSAASKIEFAGRCAVLLISLPLFTEVLGLASALIKL